MDNSNYDQVEIIEKKECQRCYQLIDARADRCVHCQSTQPFPFRLKAAHLFTIAILIFVILLSAGTYTYMIQAGQSLRIAELERANVEYNATLELQNNQKLSEKQIAQSLTAQTTSQSLKFLSRLTRLTEKLPAQCPVAAGDSPICHQTLNALEKHIWELATTRGLLDEVTNTPGACGVFRELLINLIGVPEQLTVDLYIAIYKI